MMADQLKTKGIKLKGERRGGHIADNEIFYTKSEKGTDGRFIDQENRNWSRSFHYNSHNKREIYYRIYRRGGEQ
jgi:hypothetical protein